MILIKKYIFTLPDRNNWAFINYIDYIMHLSYILLSSERLYLFVVLILVLGLSVFFAYFEFPQEWSMNLKCLTEKLIIQLEETNSLRSQNIVNLQYSGSLTFSVRGKLKIF